MSQRRRPQQTPLYRLIATVSKLQLGYLVRHGRADTLHLSVFVLMAGAIALCIISGAAYLSHLPLVFPPLAATAFILFQSPLSRNASPYNVVLSHTTGLLTGMASLRLMTFLFASATIGAPDELTLLKVGSITLAMGLMGALMIYGNFIHPPAAATALIAAMGYVPGWRQLAGFEFAMLLLVGEAIVLNRFFGGIPYPFWRWRQDQMRNYATLAGDTDGVQGFWRDVRQRIHRIPEGESLE